MSHTGYADMPLHYGRVPKWLALRMSSLGGAIVECIVLNYGRQEFLQRISDPCWFQSFGAVLGMDWHSSGITTSVMGALKKSLNPISKELGIHVCGGRGRHSRKTPNELLKVADRTGLDGDALVRCSRLSAKIDSTAIQDGYQVYLHNFIVTEDGDWAVIQQGMNDQNGMARRYHWHSSDFTDFLNAPHSSICGSNHGKILNLVDAFANETRSGVMKVTAEKPARMINEARYIRLPGNHDVVVKDVNLKRLGAIIALSHESEVNDFESLLLLPGLGPRTLQSLTLISEVIHGTPSRFEDPARFSFAHGGKDGYPFPVPTKVYDETISFLNDAVVKAKIGQNQKQQALQKVHQLAKSIEKNFVPQEDRFDSWKQKEIRDSWKYGGRTVNGFVKKPSPSPQLSLFNL